MEHIHDICIYKCIHTFICIYTYTFFQSRLYMYICISMFAKTSKVATYVRCLLNIWSPSVYLTKIRAFSEAPNLSTNQRCCLASLPCPMCRNDSSFHLRHSGGSCFFQIVLKKYTTVMSLSRKFHINQTM